MMADFTFDPTNVVTALCLCFALNGSNSNTKATCSNNVVVFFQFLYCVFSEKKNVDIDFVIIVFNNSTCGFVHI